MPNKLLTERNTFPDAPPSIRIAGTRVSETSITRENFMAIMNYILDDDADLSKLATAYELAKVSYNGQEGAVTRNTGERYFDHVKAVALIGAIELNDTSPRRTIARLFHDNHEDTRINADNIRIMFGSKIAGLVQLVSNPRKTGDEAIDKKRKKMAYLAMLGFPEASQVKVSDRIHNNRTEGLVLVHQGMLKPDIVTKQMIEKGKMKLEETDTFIMPMAEMLGGEYQKLLLEARNDFAKAIDDLKDSA